MNGDYIRGNVETIILKCLSTGELYGTQICNLIHAASEGTYTLKKPTLYSALKRLQNDKLVTIRIEESPIGGTRHYYNLTDVGREFLSTKKFDWVYSKLLIDNLVLDKKYKGTETSSDDESLHTTNLSNATTTETSNVVTTSFESYEPLPINTPPTEYNTVAAAKVSEFFETTSLPNETAVAANVATATSTNPAAEESSSSRVTVAIRELEPVEEYAVSSGSYISLPLTLGLGSISKPTQVGLDMAKVESMTPPWKPFVKHASEKKIGNFVLYNRLRLCASVIVSLVLAGAIGLTFGLLKTSYTASEVNFFAVGWVCLAVYFLANVVLFSAHPKYERVTPNKTKEFVRRGTLTACVAVLAVSINVMAGFSSINATDFLVYLIVPCIIATAFLMEGVTIMALKRLSFFTV